MLRIAHVIAGLETGGAEMMLLKLIQETCARIDHHVLSLTDIGSLGARISLAGATVHPLGLRGPLHAAYSVPRVVSLLKSIRPDLVQGWMYHGNITATLATIASRKRWPTAWAVRCTIDRFEEKLLTRALVRLSAPASRHARCILYNSTPAQVQHEAIGYAKRGLVLGNGFDLDRFVPDPAAGQVMRTQFGIPHDCPVIGYVGRLAPIKDLPTFFASATRVLETHPDIRVVAIGRNLPDAKDLVPETRASIEVLDKRLILLPEQSDLRTWYQVFDVCVLSSSAEGFPNVLGEAMATGTPCVSTNVGECSTLIGDTGRVVPPKSPKALAAAVREILNLAPEERKDLGISARARVAKHFSINSIAKAHEVQWQRLVAMKCD